MKSLMEIERDQEELIRQGYRIFTIVVDWLKAVGELEEDIINIKEEEEK